MSENEVRFPNAIQNKYDFIVLFDCKNGNPNGDPDNSNLPRVDPLTNICMVTDACIKRKIRYAIDQEFSGEGRRMYIKPDSVLNEKDELAFASLGLTEKEFKEKRKKDANMDDAVRNFMTRTFFDVRAFGAVMTRFSGSSASAIRGPVQIGLAESVSPVELRDMTITRTVVATQKELDNSGVMTTFGQRTIIPYGLFRAYGSISANLAQRYTGFSEEDLDILFKGITKMFDDDAASIRPEMYVRKLVVFKHKSIYGDAPAFVLHNALKVTEKEPGKPVRGFEDYEVNLDITGLPSSIEVTDYPLI